MHGPEQDRGADDGRRGVAFAEDREEVTQGAEQQDEVADVTQPGTDPVPPGRRETHVIAEPGLGVGIHAAVQVRFAIGEGLEHKSEGQHTDCGNCPTDQDCTDISAGGHVLWQRKNTAANH